MSLRMAILILKIPLFVNFSTGTNQRSEESNPESTNAHAQESKLSAWLLNRCTKIDWERICVMLLRSLIFFSFLFPLIPLLFTEFLEFAGMHHACIFKVMKISLTSGLFLTSYCLQTLVTMFLKAQCVALNFKPLLPLQTPLHSCQTFCLSAAAPGKLSGY